MNTLGGHIRQLRREHNLTQTALGGERFSKSYVSASERGKIMPSPKALKFFAEQLGQLSDYFITLSTGVDGNRRFTQLDEAGPSLAPDSPTLREELHLLDILLQQAEYREFSAEQEYLSLSQETLAQLSPDRQGRYSFLRGLMAQRNGQYAASIPALESALALCPLKYRPAILDELGVNYALLHAYPVALEYHLRALQTLQDEGGDDGQAAMLFRVALHCGNDCLAIGDYQQAFQHFELAHVHLNAEHDMRSAGLLYWGLGYCTYALAYQMAWSASSSTDETPEAIDQQFHQAISYQSRSIYQVSGDHKEEAQIRLSFIMMSLDLCSYRKRLTQESTARKEDALSSPSAYISSLLDTATEECLQVMMNCQKWHDIPAFSPVERTTALATALAYLVRIALLRAALAREGGLADTAYLERAVAAQLCQQALDALRDGEFPETLIRRAKSLSHGEDPAALQFTSLPRLPDLSAGSEFTLCSPAGQSEIYFAAGAVAEEFGRSATTPDYASDCYEQADRCFQSALGLAEQGETGQGKDPGYLPRAYQRCIGILEERLQVAQDLEAASRSFLSILKRGLFGIPSRFLLVGRQKRGGRFRV